MIQVIKKQGLKAALPLLLLATACGEGAPSAQQFDSVPAETYEEIAEVISANTDTYDGLKEITEYIDAKAEKEEATETLAVKVANPTHDAAVKKVPEPTALAGLAIAGMGLIGIKRKQAA